MRLFKLKEEGYCSHCINGIFYAEPWLVAYEFEEHYLFKFGSCKFFYWSKWNQVTGSSNWAQYHDYFATPVKRILYQLSIHI